MQGDREPPAIGQVSTDLSFCCLILIRNLSEELHLANNNIKTMIDSFD